MQKITFEEYTKGIEEYNKRSEKNFKYIIVFIIFSFIFFILGIALFVFASKDYDNVFSEKIHSILAAARIPYIISCSVCILLLLIPIIINKIRCPKCKKFFPKGKLEKYTSIQSTGSGMTSDGQYYTRQTTRHVYWTQCKYCGYIIWVVKG